MVPPSESRPLIGQLLESIYKWHAMAGLGARQALHMERSGRRMVPSEGTSNVRPPNVSEVPTSMPRRSKSSDTARARAAAPARANGSRPLGSAGQYKQPRLAEMIATDLRNRILSGAVGDGEMLPRQEELLDTFGVSMPSLRGALQILETEGLITVLRGSVGGAVVHAPKARTVAYNVGLVLQAGNTHLSDVATALQHLESLCVSFCTLRPDRNTTVVPTLWKLLHETRDALDDIDEVTRIARRFHEELVAQCGNDTLILLVGALEAVWSAHEHDMVSAMSREGAAPTRAEREEYLVVHEQIVGAIADGDPVHAASVAAAHLRMAERPLIARGDTTINASLLQSPAVPSVRGKR
jgi:DNA-binding FadR family transcriptional regulator